MEVEMAVTVLADTSELSFRGGITLSNAIFFYNLRLSMPIKRYMETLEGKTVKEFRQVVEICLRVGETELDLENDEWLFFYYILMGLVVGIHNRRMDQKRSGVPLSEVVWVEGGYLDLAIGGCQILARPKFHCDLLGTTQDDFTGKGH